MAATTTATAASTEPPIDRKTVLALVAMGVAVFIIANDFTALAVALPAIEKQFDTDVGTVQWVINAYALTFGVLIVVGGRLADIFGRKRIFIIGAGVFAGFSVLGGSGAEHRLADLLPRADGHRRRDDVAGDPRHDLRGVAGKPGRAGRRADSRRGGHRQCGRADVRRRVTDALSWRWIFFVNVPIAAFGVLATWLAIHQTEPEPADRRIDYAGVATLRWGSCRCWWRSTR